MAPIGDEIEPIGESRADVETGNEEDEEPWEAEIRGVRMNPKNQTSKEKQEQEDSGHCYLQELVCRVCRRSRCWWTTSNWTVGEKGNRKNNSDCGLRQRVS